MKTIFALVLLSACGAVSAQTPATNPMPDGSHDLYVGLGAVSQARYEGAQERKTRALPVLQLEWSNGIFVSGLSAGMHLSGQPTFEYGPLLGIDTGRRESGKGKGAGGVSGLPGFLPTDSKVASVNRLAGMDEVKARLQGGGFFNVYLTPSLRLTNSVLAGAGNDHDGALWRIGLQHIAGQVAPHQFVSVTAGATLVNRAWNAAYFGVTPAEAMTSRNGAYAPRGGVKDLYVGARWNWAFSPSWMLTSGLQHTRLQGDARNSPLAERSTDTTVTTALAYRF